MNRNELVYAIKAKKSMLCVGLDVSTDLLPEWMGNDPKMLFSFNKSIIEATLPFTVAYKLNSAFYESCGLTGWEAMQQTIRYLKTKPVFVIADAKRGDIGNTAEHYAATFLSEMNSDAITVSPYMGNDSVKPFLNFKNKWAILLALTSNAGSEDFQLQKLANGRYLFEEVLFQAKNWGTPENLMFVVGATQSAWLKSIRKIVPNHFLLVPGVGTQGGSLEEILEIGMNKDGGLLINASRSIIFASKDKDFAQKAGEAAEAIQHKMAVPMIQKGLC